MASVPSLPAPVDVPSLPVPAGRAPTTQQTRPPRRLVPLDGLRAFAVLTVLLYHGGVTWFGGGLLGVDVFFVLSGFLITNLLCGEFLARGTVALGRFWANRARRLLPALLLLLLGVALYAWVFRSSLDLASIRGDALSTLLYFANWHFLFSGQGYFAKSIAPSPLLPMWSLGVEEQYYLIWPLVALVALRHGGTRAVAWVAGAGAVASASLMAALYLAGASIDRLYYGTDTRAQALLVGSVLGALASTRDWRVIAEEWARRPLGRVTGAVLGVAGSAFLLWAWHALDGQEALLYQGGFLLVAFAAGAVITVVTSWRHSVLATALSWRPLTYVGTISYGLYLYHWPIFLTLTEAHTGLSGPGLFTVRISVTFAVAILSYHLVEKPVRQGHLARTWRGLAVGIGAALATTGVVIAVTLPIASDASPLPLAGDPTGLSASQHQALAASGAFTTHPIRFMLFGDSVALTASVGLAIDSTERYGVRVYDAGILGCDLSLAPDRLAGVVYPGDPSVNCGSWETTWSRQIAKVHPEVVGLLIGRFELADHYYHGTWMHLGMPVWDRHLEDKLDRAVSVLSAGGARVVLYTFPYIDPPLAQPNGALWPENRPDRVDRWNQLLDQVAATHRSTVTLVDLNRILDPQGHYTATVDGVSVRWPDDGIHISTAGGEWLQPRLLPTVGQLGIEVRGRRDTPSSRPGS
jgi:peptidoglycan/LPS O-acetylase OafA/YrhL